MNALLTVLATSLTVVLLPQAALVGTRNPIRHDGTRRRLGVSFQYGVATARRPPRLVLSASHRGGRSTTRTYVERGSHASAERDTASHAARVYRWSSPPTRASETTFPASTDVIYIASSPAWRHAVLTGPYGSKPGFSSHRPAACQLAKNRELSEPRILCSTTSSKRKGFLR
jgi:hypothetical protein